MKPMSFQKTAEDAFGNALTLMLSEEGHQAVQRICQSAVYLESDTNLVCVEIEKAVKKTDWKKIENELIAALNIRGSHNAAKLKAAMRIEQQQQLAYWKGLDKTVNFLANMPNIRPENLASVLPVYEEPLQDTDVDSAFLGVIHTQCPEMSAAQKRRFARLLEMTMERKRENLLST